MKFKLKRAGLILPIAFFSLTAIAMAQDAKPATPAATPKPAASPAPDPFANSPPAKTEDVATIDGIVKALYSVISGDAGVKRDWNRFRSLYYPNAKMVPTFKNQNTGKISGRFMTPEDYIERSGPILERDGFHEVEIARRVEQFGNIAHVFTTYQAKRKATDEKPFMRGINSVQLINDGTRWWILNPFTPRTFLILHF
jgi:hypothetical protein